MNRASDDATPAPAPPSRMQRRKAEKRARILEAARETLQRKGYAGMTIGEVAQQADVAVGTVFQYAATKAELLLMVMLDAWPATLAAGLRAPQARRPATALRRAGEPPAAQRPVADEAATPGDGDAAEDVMRMLGPFVRYARRHPELARAGARELLFGEDGAHRRALHAAFEGFEVQIAQRLQAWRRARSDTRSEPTSDLRSEGMSSATCDPNLAPTADPAPHPATHPSRLPTAHPPSPAGADLAAARLIVSGTMLELNRTYDALEGAASLPKRLRRVVDLLVRGSLAQG